MGTLAAGIKDIFSPAKTTGTNVMLCANNGTPDGHMTMANLASVLGVPTVTNYTLPVDGELQISTGYCLVHITSSTIGRGCFFRFDNKLTDISSDLNTFKIGEIEQGFICITKTAERSFTITNKWSSSFTMAIIFV